MLEPKQKEKRSKRGIFSSDIGKCKGSNGVISLDLSTVDSGWAVFSAGMLVKSGHFKNNEVFKNRFRNIFHYSQKFSRMLLAEISSAGMSIRNMKVVIENPGTFGFIYALQAGAVLTSLLIFSLFQAGIELNNFCFISPSSWRRRGALASLVLVDKNLSSSLQKKKENGKKGYNFRRNAWKVLSLASARKLNNEVINHNEADAINIGKFASSEENGGC